MTVRVRAIDLRRSWLFEKICQHLFFFILGRLLLCSYILVSFEEAPPVIFWTRSCPSSVLSSSSCLVRSSFDLPQSWDDLTRAVDD